MNNEEHKRPLQSEKHQISLMIFATGIIKTRECTGISKIM